MDKWHAYVADSLAVVEWFEDFGTRDVREALTSVTRVPGFETGTPLLLVDEGTGIGPTPRELEASADVLENRCASFGNKIAMSAKTQAHYGLGRMLEAFCELRGVRFRVFRDLATARQWLRGSAA